MKKIISSITEFSFSSFLLRERECVIFNGYIVVSRLSLESITVLGRLNVRCITVLVMENILKTRLFYSDHYYSKNNNGPKSKTLRLFSKTELYSKFFNVKNHLYLLLKFQNH